MKFDGLFNVIIRYKNKLRLIQLEQYSVMKVATSSWIKSSQMEQLINLENWVNSIWSTIELLWTLGIGCNYVSVINLSCHRLLILESSSPLDWLWEFEYIGNWCSRCYLSHGCQWTSLVLFNLCRSKAEGGFIRQGRRTNWWYLREPLGGVIDITGHVLGRVAL